MSIKSFNKFFKIVTENKGRVTLYEASQKFRRVVEREIHFSSRVIFTNGEPFLFDKVSGTSWSFNDNNIPAENGYNDWRLFKSEAKARKYAGLEPSP